MLKLFNFSWGYCYPDGPPGSKFPQVLTLISLNRGIGVELITRRLETSRMIQKSEFPCLLGIPKGAHPPAMPGFPPKEIAGLVKRLWKPPWSLKQSLNKALFLGGKCGIGGWAPPRNSEQKRSRRWWSFFLQNCFWRESGLPSLKLT